MPFCQLLKTKATSVAPPPFLPPAASALRAVTK